MPRTFQEGWGETLGWLRFELPTKRGRALSPPVPPNIEPVPANKAVLENASATLQCLASGVPPPGKPLLVTESHLPPAPGPTW